MKKVRATKGMVFGATLAFSPAAWSRRTAGMKAQARRKPYSQPGVQSTRPSKLRPRRSLGT